LSKGLAVETGFCAKFFQPVDAFTLPLHIDSLFRNDDFKENHEQLTTSAGLDTILSTERILETVNLE